MPPAETLRLSRAAGRVPRHLSGLVEDRFHHVPNVVSARAADATVLMDQKRGTYYTLNEVGGRVWELVDAGGTVSEMVERLLEEYDVSRGQLEADVAATLRQLLDDRLLARVALDSAPVEVAPRSSSKATMNLGQLKVPSVLWCGLLIAWFKGLVRTRGFLGTLEWIRQRIEKLPATAETEIETVKAVEHAVAMAGALYPGRARCLEQSLTLYYLLRQHGVAAVYCQGVQPYPFQAHAWIEYRGEVINDVPEHAEQFARLPGQLP
jgi:hypothetical protein